MFVIGIYFVCTATQFSFNGEAMLQIFASMVVLSKVLAQVAATVVLLHLNDSEQVATDLG